jgi:outer membrane usher protein
MSVVPARRSGVSVDFGGQVKASALVVLRDAVGAFLKLGADVRLHGSQTSFFVGYDGEVWLDGLGARNRITVQLDDGECRADFAYTAQSGTQVYIDEVECR